jgi:hypothetical protein
MLTFIVKESLAYLSLLIIIMGLLGNSFTFIVYYKALSKNTLSLYFRTISVVNSCMLILFSLREAIILKFNWDFVDVNGWTCRVVVYIGYSLGAMPAWLLVAVSIDRLVNIKFPRKFLFVFNKAFQLGLIATICAYNFIYYAYLIGTYDLHMGISIDAVESEKNWTCESTLQHVANWMDILNSTILPFVFMTIFSIVLIISVRKSRSRLRTVSFKISNNERRDRKFAVTSLSLNALFLVLNLPITIINVLITSNIEIDSNMSQLLVFAFSAWYSAFYAVDFYVQIWTNKIFRKNFLFTFYF